MAQTKRKRRSKHRGTAAGVVESRGRTGRKPTPAEQKKAVGRAARENRFDKPPSWRSAANRGLLTTVIFFVVLMALGEPVSAAISVALFALAIYIPLGYYTDQFIYRRRQRKKLLEKAGK